MIREGDIGEKLFPDFPDMKVDFSEIGIGKIGKIGLAPPPKYTLQFSQSIRTLGSSVRFHKFNALHFAGQSMLIGP